MIERVVQRILSQMIAMRVKINGRPTCLAGDSELCILDGQVACSGDLESEEKQLTSDGADAPNYALWLSVSGRTDAAEDGSFYSLEWISHHRLRVGDEVEFSWSDVTEADLPKRTKEVEENL